MVKVTQVRMHDYITMVLSGTQGHTLGLKVTHHLHMVTSEGTHYIGPSYIDRETKP